MFIHQNWPAVLVKGLRKPSWLFLCCRLLVSVGCPPMLWRGRNSHPPSLKELVQQRWVRKEAGLGQEFQQPVAFYRRNSSIWEGEGRKLTIAPVGPLT